MSSASPTVNGDCQRGVMAPTGLARMGHEDQRRMAQQVDAPCRDAYRDNHVPLRHPAELAH
jgi:hypothetical protein